MESPSLMTRAGVREREEICCVSQATQDMWGWEWWAYTFCTFIPEEVIGIFPSLASPSIFKTGGLKRLKQTVAEKADTKQNKMSQGSRGRLVYMFIVQCEALLDAWNFP